MVMKRSREQGQPCNQALFDLHEAGLIS